MLKKLILSIINRLEEKSGDAIAIPIRNLKVRLKGWHHSFLFDKDKKLYCIVDRGSKHYFANRRRGFELYFCGLSHRANSLNDSYLLGNIKFDRDDVVVDCGANYADLWLTLKGCIDDMNYFTFEPGKGEFASICANASNSNNYNLGLGKENSYRKFYVNDSDADSSFIEPVKYMDVLEVETIKLDKFVKEYGLKSIKLLKLEAEGFEPEILEGAINTLPIIDYIAIDGGCERGVLEEETFTFQTNFLFQNGFYLMGVNLKWSRALFRRVDN